MSCPLTLCQQYSWPSSISWACMMGEIMKKTHQFSQADLQYITADQIYHWETFRIYENPDADEGIVPLQHYHHSGIGWKRKISYSVPFNHIA